LRPIVKLPAQLDGQGVMELASSASAYYTDGIWPTELYFDFSALKFIKPTGIVFLSNLIDWLDHNGCTVYFRYHQDDKDALRFLDDSQFFKVRLGETIREDASCRATTFELEKVENSYSSARLNQGLVPWLAAQLNTRKEAAALQDIKNTVQELFNNIGDHTQFNIGGICAQHFPKINEIEFAIADFGLGIPESVRNIEPGIESDCLAIEIATREGFTTKGVPNNKGAGLGLLKDVCVGVHGGMVTIYSGCGIVSFKKEKNQVLCTKWDSSHFCPGTVIKIQIKTDQLDLSDLSEQDFDWEF